MATTGMVLGGRYHLLDVLGDGGMARVFRAEDRRLSRIVAVKILHQHYAQQEGFVRRFEGEAQLAAALVHPNVVAIYDVGRDDDTYYIVMEYVEGSSLKEVIAREAPLPLARIVPIVRQLAQALDAAHVRGIVHRDIKPENILLTLNDGVKVSDFGIARVLTDQGQTATGMVLGSVSYFSPEQAQGRPATAESDLYSCGIVLYEMLTGRPPFVADNPVATAMQQITQQPVPPRSLVRSLPPEVDGVVLKALSKDPRLRYHSGGALADALSAVGTRPRQTPVRSTATQGLGATRVAPVATIAAAPRRSPLVPATLALVLAGVLYMTVRSVGADLFLGASPAATTTSTPTVPASPTVTAAVGVLVAATATAVVPPATATPLRTPSATAAAFTATRPPSTRAGSSATAPPPTATLPATRGAVGSATPTAHRRSAHPTPSAPTRTPTAAVHHPATPTARARPKPTSGAGLVVAASVGQGVNDVPVPLNPRDTFDATARQVYVVVHLAHRPPNAIVTMHWMLPDGQSRDEQAAPYDTFFSYIDTAGPGRYRVQAVVNGKVIATKTFTVKGSAAQPHTTSSTAATQLMAGVGLASDTHRLARLLAGVAGRYGGMLA